MVANGINVNTSGAFNLITKLSQVINEVQSNKAWETMNVNPGIFTPLFPKL